MDSTIGLDFLGAAGTVTGSKMLMRYRDRTLLIDCGLFQGYKNLRQLNWAAFGFDPKELDAVVLTHAHLDHSGALPLLVRQGYRGPIYASAATVAVCKILLKDSAKLQEEEAEYANRHQTSQHKPAKPLYDSHDVQATLGLFTAVEFKETIKLFPEVSVQLQHAGHILGAASVRLTLGTKVLLFSGDLGRLDAPIMLDPEPVGETDYIVMESTYGNRDHPDENPKQQLTKIINETVAGGGSILMPAFAVGRSQVLLQAIAQLRQTNQIGDIPVFLDSPMAINVTELYERFHQDHRFSKKDITEAFNIAYMAHTVEESKALNGLRFPRIIISASGMATGGRVLHHLKALVEDHRNAIVFAGFQASGTRGGRMLAGEPTVRIFGHDYRVNASVHSVAGYSAHADAKQLLQWLKTSTKKPNCVFLNHGEPHASDILRQRIQNELGISCRVPLLGERINLE